jgi:hypothetical protein
MNEGYIDDGFVGFPSFFISFKLGTMRNSKESKKLAFDRSLGCWAHDNGPLFVYMNEGYIHDGFVRFPSFCITLKLGTMREIPSNPRNSHLIEEA